MSSPRALSIAEQIQVLHSDADVATFALQNLGLPAEWRDTNETGNTERCQEAVNRVFTLTRADIEADLAAKALQPEQLPFVHTTPGSRDGWYLLKQGSVWEFSWQERGFPNFLVAFADLAEARKLVLNHFIPTWLDHLHLPCQTADGRTMTTL